MWLKDAHGGERTRTIDVSAHGVLLPTHRALALRQYVELEITLPTEERVALTAMVSRIFGTGAALDFFTIDSEAQKRWQAFLSSVPREGPAFAPPIVPGAGEGLVPTFMLKPGDLTQLWSFYRGPLARGTLRLESPVRTPEGAAVEVVVVHPQSRVEWGFAATVQTAEVSSRGQPLLDVVLDDVDTRVRADFRAFVASGSLPLRLDPASGQLSRDPSEVVDIDDLEEESISEISVEARPAEVLFDEADSLIADDDDTRSEMLPALIPQDEGWLLDVETRRYLDALDPGRRNAFHVPSLELESPDVMDARPSGTTPSPFDADVAPLEAPPPPPHSAEEATTDEPSPFGEEPTRAADLRGAHVPTGDEPALFEAAAAPTGDELSPLFDVAPPTVGEIDQEEQVTGEASPHFPDEPTGTDDHLLAVAQRLAEEGEGEDFQDAEEETRTSTALEAADHVEGIEEIDSVDPSVPDPDHPVTPEPSPLAALDADDVADFIESESLPGFGEEEEETMVAGPVPGLLAEPELVVPPRPFETFFAEAEAAAADASPFDSPPTPVSPSISNGERRRRRSAGRNSVVVTPAPTPDSGISSLSAAPPPKKTQGTWLDAHPSAASPNPEAQDGLRIIPRVRGRAADEIGAVAHQPVSAARADAELDRQLGLARARVVRRPDDPESVAELADLLLLARSRSELLGETIDILERLLTLRPEVTETHARLAELKARAGRYREAQLHLGEAEALGVDVDPDLARVVSLGSQ